MVGGYVDDFLVCRENDHIEELAELLGYEMTWEDKVVNFVGMELEWEEGKVTVKETKLLTNIPPYLKQK